MSLSSGFPPIPNSITDTVILEQNIIDADVPIPFTKFQTIVGYYNENVKGYYSDYVRKWNEIKKTSSKIQSVEILNRYKNFIREIAINYANIEEKTFFDNIDFDDDHQLEMAIPFFTEKIKQIASYYKGKREDVKFQTTRNKSVGIKVDLKNKIKDFTINFIENLPDAAIKYDVDSIKENITIEVDELFDSYPLYFDQTPDPSVYDYKDLDYGLDIFLRTDDDLINEVFSGVSEEIKTLKEAASLFDLKRKETIGNISTNFYYISTGSTATEYISGRLFENTASIGNFYNKNYPTTASTSKNVLESDKERGFFKPHKTGILLLDGKRQTFTIDSTNLKPNSLYYFPDPLLTSNENFIEFIIDENGITKNQTSGYAKLEPIITQNDTTFHGYVSEKVLGGESKYLQDIFNRGYVKDTKRDLFGNLYGLFTDDNNFRIGFEVEIEKENTVKSLQLNGHTFYDNVYNEGFAFNYTTFDDTPNNFTIRSGLSANTGNFSELTGAYTLFGRYFTPYEDLYDPTSTDKTYTYYDGGFLSDVNDPISSDLNAFPGIGAYYYDLLLEGGIHTVSPLQRALLDPLFPTLTANILGNLIPNNSTIFDIDGGSLSDVFISNYNFQSPQYYFDNTVNCDSDLTIDSFNTVSYMERKELNGLLFVKNIYTGVVTPISSGIPYLSSILSPDALSSMTNNTVRFEVIDDLLCVETDKYFISFKIGFDGMTFENPKNSPIVEEINDNPFNRISERFYIDGKIYYNLFNTTYPLSSKDLQLDFSCRAIDVLKMTNKLIGSENITLSGDYVIYDKMDFPIVSFDNDEKTFNVSTLLKDQNYMFDILDISYQISPYSPIHVKLHENSADSYSNIITSSITILSSANITTPTPYLLVI